MKRKWVESVTDKYGNLFFHFKSVLYKRTPKGIEYYQTPDGKWKKCVTLKIKGMA